MAETHCNFLSQLDAYARVKSIAKRLQGRRGKLIRCIRIQQEGLTAKGDALRLVMLSGKLHMLRGLLGTGAIGVEPRCL